MTRALWHALSGYTRPRMNDERYIPRMLVTSGVQHLLLQLADLLVASSSGLLWDAAA